MNVSEITNERLKDMLVRDIRYCTYGEVVALAQAELDRRGKVGEVKEYPILFSGPMVRAILDGSKTMTRRVVKMPADMLPNPSLFLIDPGGTIFGPGPYIKTWRSEDGADIMNERIRCHYGYPGDRLWVRETWATSKSLDHVKPSDLAPGAPIEYAADRCLTISGGKLPDRGKWRPSIFMPPWASRITLEITGTRVERLQKISEEDALAEGIEPGDSGVEGWGRFCYRKLWNSMNEKRGYGWDVNPWVWVVGFRRLPS
jgi:hypothetical protein